VIDTVLKLRQALVQIAGNSLGRYQRPDGSTASAIWVLDRPLPKGVEVIVSSPDEPPVPAIEIIIHSPPEIRTIPARNFGSTRKTDHGWRVWIVCHESRQDPIAMIKQIGNELDSVDPPVLSPRTDLNPDFYTIKVWIPEAASNDI
jgi:hypothetical protein